MITKKFPNLGIGIGLRPVHYPEIFANKPEIDWFEIISENFMTDSSVVLRNLEEILQTYPVVQHGVSLFIGSSDPLDWDYLKRLKKLARKTKTPWISDHLCWGRVEGSHYHDLLPLPYKKEIIRYVAERARIVQDFLEVPFALENVSTYASFSENEMPEWEFYTQVVEQAGIYMMFDVNNVYVSSRNQNFDPYEYHKNIPLDRVIQIHLAGHMDKGNYVIDTHDQFVCDEVWKLYATVYPLTQGVSTLLEWDSNFISFDETWREALKAKAFQKTLQYETVGKTT